MSVIKSEETKQNSIDEYLEIVNDLKVIENYPNLSRFLVIPKERLESRLNELLTA